MTPVEFRLTYKGADDKLHRPIMIHRAPFGSMERFVAVLLEHTGGSYDDGSRSEKVILNELGGCKGIIQSDGYSPYRKLERCV